MRRPAAAEVHEQVLDETGSVVLQTEKDQRLLGFLPELVRGDGIQVAGKSHKLRDREEIV